MTDFQGAVLFLLGAILLLLAFAFPAAASELVWALLATLAIVSFVMLVGFLARRGPAAFRLVRRGPAAFREWLSRWVFPLLRSPSIWLRLPAYLLTIASAIWVPLWLVYAVLEAADPLNAVASVTSGLGPPFAGWVLLQFLNDWRDATRRRKGLLDE